MYADRKKTKNPNNVLYIIHIPTLHMFALVLLFNGISTFIGFLMPKPTFLGL